MKSRVIAFAFLLLPVLLFCQTSDPVLDSLKRPLPKEATVRLKAERMQAILWRIFRMEEESMEDFPQRLDSLHRCCIAGKTGDRRFQKTLAADIDFFRAYQLLNEQPAAAKPILENAIQQFRSLGDSTKTAFALLQICFLESNLGDSLAFSAYLEQALSRLPYISDPYSQAQILCNAGVGCYDFGRYAEAAAHYFASLKIIEANRTPDLLTLKPDIYYNLCGVYRRIGDGDNSLNYSKKAIESAKETHQDTLAFYTPLSWALMWKNDFRGALRVLKLTEGISEGDKSANRLGENAYVQANCYRHLGIMDSAMLYARKSVELLPIPTNSTYGAHALLELANCEFELGIPGALQKALTAFESFSASKSNQGFLFATELLVKIYQSRGEYRKALEYSELRFSYQAQAERQQSTRQLAFGEFTRDNEVKTAKREAEVQAQLTRQRNIRYALFAGLGVLALLTFLLYNRYRFKQRTAQQLEAKNQEVEAARERAERSEAFKSRFLANMSHEIRTPLHGIAGYTDLLLETALTEKQRRYLTSVRHSNERLTEVVNDILDISKLEAGEVKLRQVPFSPAQIAEDVREALAPRAESKGIELKVSIGENVPAAVLGDPTRLYQILMNLAGNAVKFTEKGEVRLTVDGGRQTVDGLPAHVLTPLTFSLSDTGIGIRPEKLASIFDSFQQAEGDTTARFGGTGLGLTIARELVQLHGSDIQVESEVGKGSTFSFTLALPMANAADLEQTAAEGDNLYFSQKLRIILADDNAFNREIATEALLRHFENVEIVEAENGKEAVEMLEAKSGGDFKSPPDFDLVLMDMQMPEMNGLEATRQIREVLKSDIPIIALTASATPEEIEAALAAGMNRHLAKPFKPGELAAAIAETLRLTGGAGKDFPSFQNLGSLSPSVAPFIPHPSPLIPAYNLAYLRDFCGGDEEQVRHFIEKFEAQWPLEMERLEKAFENEDCEAIYQVAHSCRPQLEFVGLRVAAALTGEMEQTAHGEQSLGALQKLFSNLLLELSDIPHLRIKTKQ